MLHIFQPETELKKKRQYTVQNKSNSIFSNLEFAANWQWQNSMSMTESSGPDGYWV